MNLLLSFFLAMPAATAVVVPPANMISFVLDDWHQAASVPDEERYFAHFAPEAVFIGTDSWERWDLNAFREYAHERFATGKGWTLVPSDRKITLSEDKKTAWFDEVVTSQSYGPSRGSGVLVLRDGVWKIAQYNLSVPIPNELLIQFADIIKAWRNKK